MGQKSKAISDDLYEQAKKSLKEAGREGEAGRRPQAIISVKPTGLRPLLKFITSLVPL